MTLEELAEAVIVDIDAQNIDPDDRFIQAIDVLDIGLSTMVTVGESGLVTLAHQSVKDFLLSKELKKAERSASFFAVNETGHLEIAKTCLTYMSLEPFREGPCKSESSFKERCETYPLLDFCAKSWFEHVKLLPDADQLRLISLAQNFWVTDKSSIFGSWLQVFRDINYLSRRYELDHLPYQDYVNNDATPIYYLCLWGLKPMIVSTIDWLAQSNSSKTSINAMEGYYGSALHAACRSGHAEIVRILISHGADLKAINSKGKNVLHLACQSGDLELVRMLIEEEPSLTTECDDNGQTALHFSAAKGHMSIIKALLDLQGAPDVNEQNEQGDTPLDLAIINGWPECVKVLLESGSLISTESTDKDTSIWDKIFRLDVSSKKDTMLKLVDILLSHGADIAHSATGYSLLHCAAAAGMIDLAKKCLDAGVNPRAKTSEMAESPLHMVMKDQNPSHGLPGNQVEMVQLLLDHGAEINANDFSNETPLHRACNSGLEEVVQLLINKGANMNSVDDDDNTMLHKACYGGNMNIVKLIVETRPLQMNMKNNNDETPIFNATKYPQVFEYLVDNGADIISCRNKLFEEISMFGNIHICKYFLAVMETSNNSISSESYTMGFEGLLYNADQNALHNQIWLYNHIKEKNVHAFKEAINLSAKSDPTAPIVSSSEDHNISNAVASSNNANLVQRFILEQGLIDLNVEALDGFKPLHSACQNGIDVVQVLLEFGADINGRLSSDLTTPLHQALSYSNFKVARFLLDRGADPRATDKEGYEPIHYLTDVGTETLEMIEIFRGHGADLKKPTSKGCTILHKLVSEMRADDSPKYVNILIEKYGVDPSAINKAGETILHLAALNSQTRLLRILLSRKETSLRIDAKTNTGKTALHFAADFGSPVCVRLLLEAGADPDSVFGSKNLTALHVAARSANLLVVKALLRGRANPCLLNKAGLTPAASIDMRTELDWTIVRKVLYLAEVDRSLEDMLM